MQLRNSHTGFDDARLGAWNQPLGFSVRPIAGRWTVIGSAVDGLRPGDGLAAVDGEPIDRFLPRNRRYVAAGPSPRVVPNRE